MYFASRCSIAIFLIIHAGVSVRLAENISFELDLGIASAGTLT
jgi:hypothetical protein